MNFSLKQSPFVFRDLLNGKARGTVVALLRRCGEGPPDDGHRLHRRQRDVARAGRAALPLVNTTSGGGQRRRPPPPPTTMESQEMKRCDHEEKK